MRPAHRPVYTEESIYLSLTIGRPRGNVRLDYRSCVVALAARMTLGTFFGDEKMTTTGNRRQVASTGIRVLACLAVVAFLAAGCGSGNVMMKAERISAPEQGKALVTFVRPSGFGGAISFGMWDGEDLVGVLNAGACIQRQVAPGEHYFLARAENWSCVKADLAPNKHYVIKANPVMGVMKARVALDPVTQANYESGQTKNVQKWLAKLKPMTPDPQKAGAYAADRQAQVREACSMFQSGKGRYETLASQDCLPQ